MKLIIPLFAFYTTISLGQKIDSMKIVIDFENGGTTGMVYSTHASLDSSNSKISWIEKVELNQWNRIMHNGTIKKHWQQKYGTRLLFAYAWIDGELNRVVIDPNQKIINLTTMKEIRIREEDLKIFKELACRHWPQHELCAINE